MRLMVAIYDDDGALDVEVIQLAWRLWRLEWLSVGAGS